MSDVLYKRAEGNPLFTEELLACPDSCHEIPDSLADLLQQTVRRLPDNTQEVLRVASAGSGSISHALLANVTGRNEEELAAFIRPAVAANVLVTMSDGYAFRHALIREAVHEDLLPGEHAAVHTRFARAIDADPALVPMAALLRALALVPETVSRKARTQLLLSASHCVENGRDPQFRAWAEEALRFAREAGDLGGTAVLPGTRRPRWPSAPSTWRRRRSPG